MSLKIEVVRFEPANHRAGGRLDTHTAPNSTRRWMACSANPGCTTGVRLEQAGISQQRRYRCFIRARRGSNRNGGKGGPSSMPTGGAEVLDIVKAIPPAVLQQRCGAGCLPG